MLRAKGGGEEALSQDQERLLHRELQVAQEELDTMAKLNSRLGYEIKRNELALTNMMKNYDGRKQFARRLEADVNKAEASAGNNSKTGLNKIEEETDWECGSNDEDSDDEEIKAGTVHTGDAKEVFPVLAPPEQFQNCLSPSATYENPGPRQSVVSPAYSNDSSIMTSSTATEKSVRFSDRDYILSTPEPRMTGSTQCSAPILHQRTNISTSNSSSSMGHLQLDRTELLPLKVKSILKSEQNTPTYSKKYTEGSNVPDVTS